MIHLARFVLILGEIFGRRLIFDGSHE